MRKLVLAAIIGTTPLPAMAETWYVEFLGKRTCVPLTEVVVNNLPMRTPEQMMDTFNRPGDEVTKIALRHQGMASYRVTMKETPGTPIMFNFLNDQKLCQEIVSRLP